jgi:ABC-type multidrug transport system ATPase subunit
MISTPGEAVIETRQLTKHYGRFTALDGLDLSVPSGALFGFIGPNGAGKTTTLRLLAGLLEPSKGQIYLDGQDISRDVTAARWLVGYMPDFFGVYEDMKVWEYLDFFARADRHAQRRAGLPRRAARHRLRQPERGMGPVGQAQPGLPGRFTRPDPGFTL